MFAEPLGVGFKLFRLNLIVTRSIDLAENTVNKVVGDGQLDVVVVEEQSQEVTELSAVEVAILVFIELVEVTDNLVVQVSGIGIE